MISKVTKLYDYTQAEIPAELCLWRVSDQEIEDQLTELSRSHALEMDGNEVRSGDSVVCKGESAVARWNKPVLLFYPRSGLCEKVLEDALLGLTVGESKTVAASEGEVTLTVTRIVRREAHPIGDALVKLEAIDGVRTVEDYRHWYRTTTEERNRRDRLAHIAHHLLNEVVEKSECAIDEEEESKWAWDVANIEYQSAVAQGIDPTIPEDGTEFLTEEQARQKYFDMCKPLFRGEVVYPALDEQLSGQTMEEYFQAELKRMAEVYYHMSAEELLSKTSEWMMRGQIFHNGALRLLQEYGKQLLED